MIASAASASFAKNGAPNYSKKGAASPIAARISAKPIAIGISAFWVYVS